MKTYSTKQADIERKWYLVDAEGMVLGRLASELAGILRGKSKPVYAPHLDVGDHVVVVNADKVVLTGDKLEKKRYYRHSGYPGGLREITYRTLMQDKPELVVRRQFGACSPRTGWEGPCSGNCTSMRGLIIPTRRRSRRGFPWGPEITEGRWKSCRSIWVTERAGARKPWPGCGCTPVTASSS